MLFRETVKHTIVVNTSIRRLVVNAETTVHAGDVAVEEDNRYQKLKLIGQTLALEYVAAELQSTK